MLSLTSSRELARSPAALQLQIPLLQWNADAMRMRHRPCVSSVRLRVFQDASFAAAMPDQRNVACI